MRADEGLLLGGMLESTSTPFKEARLARDFLTTSLEHNATKCKARGFVYGPGTRVELSPATDHWMRGDRFGTILKVTPSGVLHVKLDKSKKTTRVKPEYLYGYAQY
jgi:hypothetical protein